ncbi:MAG: hypothetical protein ABIT38_04615, partial [Gemmatimonadaceae bacterium]
MNRLLFAFPIVAMLAQLLPVVAVAPQWKKVEPVRRWIAVWGMVFFLSDILQLAASGLHTNNLWIYIFTNPVEDGIVLFALSFWQARPVARIAYRVAIPLFIFTYLSIAFGVGDPANFQAVAGPFRAFVVLSATLFTLISRVAQSPEDVGSRDWFWATVGIA